LEEKGSSYNERLDRRPRVEKNERGWTVDCAVQLSSSVGACDRFVFEVAKRGELTLMIRGRIRQNMLWD